MTIIFDKIFLKRKIILNLTLVIFCMATNGYSSSSSSSSNQSLIESTIDICLQHDDKAGCAKLSVKIPNVQDGESLPDGDILQVYAIALSNSKIQVISDRIAQKDDEGDFLKYCVVPFRGDLGDTIVPILYNLTESKPSLKQFYISPYDDRCKHVSLNLYLDETYDDTWYPVDGYYYRFPIDGSKHSISTPNWPISPSKFLIQYEKIRGRIFQGNVKSRTNINTGSRLTYIREIPFSNEVSVFGAVWDVFNMYEKDLRQLGDKGGIALDRLENRPVTRIFPRMDEEQYNALGFPDELGKNYEENYENAFYYLKNGDDIAYLCFFPIEEDSSQYESRLLTTVAHETGHNFLDVIKKEITNRFINDEQDIYSQAFDE